MQNWALAQKKINTADPNADIELPFQIIQEASIPIIVTNKDSIRDLIIPYRKSHNPIRSSGDSKFIFF